MKVLSQAVQLQPSVLSNTISWANQEEVIPVLSVVAGAQNLSDVSLEEEPSRINDDSTGVVAKPVIGARAELDAWLKFRTPARAVPVVGKRLHVQQLLPDGTTVELELRKRCSGNQPMRLQAVGYGSSTSTVQVLHPDVLKGRESRSADSVSNQGAGGTKLTQFPTSTAADNKVLADFVEHCAIVDDTIKYQRKVVEHQHMQYVNRSGGNNTADRWLYKNVVEKSDTEAEAYVEDTNVDEWRETPVDTVPVGTKSFNQWDQSRKLSLDKKKGEAELVIELALAEQDRTERLRYQRALKQYAHCNGPVANSRLASPVTLNETVGTLNAMSLLSDTNPHQSADEIVYKQWLKNHDVHNPIIDSSRISYLGKWLGHRSLNGKTHEVVGNMKRLNEERTTRRLAVTQRAADHASYTAWWETVDLEPQAANDSVFELIQPTAAEVRKYGRKRKEVKTPEPTYLDQLIKDGDVFVEIAGTMVRVSNDALRSALM